jgi:MFS transporter, NNP family, nitrate/nitrite transporter
MTGIVGAAGGFGGFLLPSILGSVKQATGSFGIGLAILAAAALGGVAALVYLKGVWRRTWPASAACRAGLRQEADEPDEVYAAGV